MHDAFRGRARVRPPAVAAALAIGLLAACSGGTKAPPAPPPTTLGAAATAAPPPSAAATAASTTATTAASAGPDIVVEGVVTLKNHPDADVGFEARVNRFNKAGGLNGRMIRFLGVKDDGLDSNADLTLVQQIVDRDHVFAVAPVVSEAMLAPSAAFLAQAHVPAFGWGTSPAFCASGGTRTAVGLSWDGCQINPAYQSDADLADLEHVTGLPAAQVKLAVVGDDLDADKSMVQALTGLAKAQGIQVVYQSNAVSAAGQTDYAPIVQAILGAGPNVVYEVTDFAGSVALAGVLQGTGYTGAVFNRVAYAPATMSSQSDIASTLNGVYVEAPYPVNEDSGDAAVSQMQADLQAIGKPAQVDLANAIGYWSADLLIQLLQATASRGAVTPQAMLATAAAGWTYHGTAGGPGDLAFPTPGWTQPDGCSTLVQLTGTTYKEVEPYTCRPVTKVG
jgi:ABC-type branched-subunit amino acid transport system substrate-binding protein